MSISTIRLVEQLGLMLSLTCILMFTLPSTASVEIGNSREQIEQKYGNIS
jgi:hypothetical protein